MVRIIDGRINTPYLVDGEATDPKLDSLFQMQRLVGIDTPEAWVAFPTAYADTPVVATTPGPDATYARIINVTPDSFSWQADAAGSASWMSWGHRS